jgi:hypothetical protein
LTPGYYTTGFIRKISKIQVLPIDYLSGGSDLIHRLLFPEVPFARYISWPQVLVKREQKKLKGGI